MNSLANRIAIAIKNANPEETHSVEVMQYSLGIILNTLLIIVSTAFIGLIFGRFEECLTFLLCFCILRLTSGGFHLKTAMACNIVTTLLSTLLPSLISPSDSALWIINIISLVIVVLFAPNPDQNARIPTSIYPILKLVSIVIVSSNFFLHSAVIGLAFLVQSLTVIPWTRGDNVEKNYC
ncbi:accessory gene regulator B family protein [Paenibacillus tritici]|jgi:accessory gene regulator B|uniref:Accessory gene regulator B family protein n=1 Tax=Paenibacillus tritici TaxID=1873425 RepID=A0ABX2DJZ5_9BACL|nr:accessory gene regulator B family protein [Paenibacillus tritici]NQX44953.1 accessory gene regulator B family protein [Paenibacillus tritici]